MPANRPPTFRPTAVRLWPANPGELPSVRVYELETRQGIARWQGYGGTVEVPLDFVLREPLDLPDDLPDDSVLSFMKEWGPLTGAGPAALEQLPAHEREGLPVSHSDWRLDVQRHHLRALRAAASHYLAHAAGRDVCDAWTLEGFNAPRSGEGAWDWWADYVNSALAAFSMHVVLEADGESTRGFQHDTAHPTIYAVAMRQLAQLASEGEQIRHCANSRCGKPFTRQRGRADYGQQHATGVLYCSRLCARAQAERARRERRAAERKGSTS